MSEFKAQLLGILIVISIFGVLSAGYKLLVKNSFESIDKELDNQMSLVTPSSEDISE